MFLQSGDAKYIDVLERSLYNAAIAGVSLRGDTFFYPNPLESDGKYAFNQGALTRKPWFDSSCCPTNIARFIPSIPDYIYAVREGALFVNLFVDSEATITMGGSQVRLAQETDYPWDGGVRVRLAPDRPRAFDVRVRIPGWVRGRPVPSELYRYADATGSGFELRVNDERVTPELVDGYAVISRTWKEDDHIRLDLPMPVRRVLADERVEDDRGRVAIERGPLVYAAEGVDNGGSVLDVVVPDDSRFETEHRPELLGGVMVLKATAKDRRGAPKRLTLIPYYAWSHRGPGEMAVWMARK
jgi:hypothetical protein